ncbi:MAG: DUF4173 domain-containing protein [Clostridia bacterium]|nr:DUF4173 domain-containing protein [Clostridia bacterium]
MFKVIMAKEEKSKNKTGLGIFIGVLVGLPIFAVVTGLLCSADQRFSQVTAKLLNFINVDFLSVISDIVLGICLSVFIYGAIFYNRHTTEIQEQKQLNSFVINQAVGTTVLFMVSISYILYLVLQFEYLFSAISGKLPENFIYSQYARSGFFELFIIAVINFVLVVFFANTGKGKVLKTAVLLVSSITLLLIISSVSKMILYIREYDLTRLRVYTTWFMAVLFIIFVFIIVKMFNEKIKIFNSSLAIFLSMYLILNIVNTDGIIGRYNTENYMNGSRETIDIENIASLSDSGIIYLEKIAEGDYPESEQATYALCKRKDYINNKKDWLEFNISTLILKEKLKNIDETVYVYYD